MDRQGTFDYILLETTGLADPGNIAPMFWVDEGLGSTIYLDGIVTMVDAKNVLRSLEEPVGEERVNDDEDADGHQGQLLSTAHLQISHADVIILNKSDLVSASELESVKARIRSINALAKIEVTAHSQVPQLEGLVLDLHAYDSVDAETLDFASKGHSHLDPSIGTMMLELPTLKADTGLENLDAWLRSVLWESELPGAADPKGWEIHRIKGRIRVDNGATKMLQGVREIFELIDAVAGSQASTEDEEKGKIVIIGRNVGDETSRERFQKSLLATIER